MRIQPFWLAVSICFFFACSTKQNDPIEGQIIQPITVKRFDTAFFAMDTNHISKGITGLFKRYPEFSSDYFTRILQVDPIHDTQKIKKYYKELSPIYNATLGLNASDSISHHLNKVLARFHFYFPSYKMPETLIYYISPYSTYFNVLNEHYLGIGLQITQQPTYLAEQISFYCIQNLLDDHLMNDKKEATLLYQMIEAGKRQYILQKINLQIADTVLWNYSSIQLKAVQEQEAAIWQYLVEQKMLMSKERIDALNIMSDAPQNSLLGASLPGNIGKYIGYKIVLAYMNRQSKTTYDNLEKLAATSASIIYAEAGYHP